jgi:hypothetical protein
MKRVFYISAVLLAIAWIVSYFIFHAGRGTHVLILLAATSWLQAIITIPSKKYILGGMNGGRRENAVKEQHA